MNGRKAMHYEEFAIDDEFITLGRTITETDIVNFSGLSGDYNPLHTDEEFARETMFGSRIAHGLLVLSIAMGLNMRLGITEGTTIAILGIDWKFTAPVFAGDTIHMEMVVKSMRETKKPDRGIIQFDCRVVKQDGTRCQEGIRTVMLKRIQPV